MGQQRRPTRSGRVTRLGRDGGGRSSVTDLPKYSGTDYEGARHGLMNSLGGTPIGRSARPKKLADLVALHAFLPRAG
jgi:hypothetical protein